MHQQGIYNKCTRQSRANLKTNVKFMLDFKKIDIRSLQKQLKQSKCDNVNYVMFDINYRLKVVVKDGSGKFFNDNMSLKDILEKKGVNQV